MAKQTISLGTEPKGETGDTSRVAFLKCIANFDELYARLQASLSKDISGAAGLVTLTEQEALNGFIDLTGQITGNRQVAVPALPVQSWLVRNSTSGAFGVTFKTTTGTGIAVPAGASIRVFSDGVNIVDPVSAAVAAALSDESAKEIGFVKWVAYNGYDVALPSGYIKANGAAITRWQFAALFAKIGTKFGAGDGANTFNLPDLRGEFIRGWDDARGIDIGRLFGMLQGFAIQTHDHPIPNYIPTGSFAQTGTSVTLANNNGNNYVTGPAGGSETRPRNVALLPVIKYK